MTIRRGIRILYPPWALTAFFIPNYAAKHLDISQIFLIGNLRVFHFHSLCFYFHIFIRLLAYITPTQIFNLYLSVSLPSKHLFYIENIF